jgi:hypothetical protein
VTHVYVCHKPAEHKGKAVKGFCSTGPQVVVIVERFVAAVPTGRYGRRYSAVVAGLRPTKIFSYDPRKTFPTAKFAAGVRTVCTTALLYFWRLYIVAMVLLQL